VHPVCNVCPTFGRHPSVPMHCQSHPASQLARVFAWQLKSKLQAVRPAFVVGRGLLQITFVGRGLLQITFVVGRGLLQTLVLALAQRQTGGMPAAL